jgi:hypothetical protein
MRDLVDVYHIIDDNGEKFVCGENEYTFEEFCLALEYEGLTTEDFELINEGSEVESVTDCIAIWRIK